MKKKKIEQQGTDLPESWFIERIGKKIMAESSVFNGEMEIKDDHHAAYLCRYSQVYHNYKFSDIEKKERACRVCGCTDNDCRQCIEKTGQPCHWVEENLCSACS